ncbi:organoarsenical effux MFS transporter ArsJ [Natronospira bacteriovora]|uniref:Organoarsenical effux MFS transporter ArsJ n=2 Tax=Natronospira bacteriovora TaxID=3069753 RepID=A0ABU0W4L8_9GAMM|nr:organoarsenical effux MFS transporter ArsJ [Natronospira sp. AB-CW4]MDQ2068894.1 organoarsenical effux MFS transporter ArsJ [Natronospira sp. AB-CW4]
MERVRQLPEAIRQYMVVTMAYWSFTITDGALRMLVLLYFYQLGYSPFEVAMLFVLYELFGVITNLLGGWIGARFGLHRTLFAGMFLQVVALLMLTVPEAWLGVIYVMLAQALSGIAKDLNKMSAKSSVKLLVPAGESGRLFKWVAALTGSKNALKGVGFFVGSALLGTIGFQVGVLAMAVWIAVFFLLSLILLRRGMGQASGKTPFRQILSKSRAVNYLSAARFFLFGARDIWFVVALPVFLQGVLGWSHVQVGTFMALWVIGYGVVQSLAPRFARLQGRDSAHGGRRAAIAWAIALALSLALMVVALDAGFSPAATLIIGLGLFGFLFAINSSLHSWLILEYARGDGVSLDVGFYYMANAAGRLVGTLLSGLVYQFHGLSGCLLAALAFILLSSLIATALPKPAAPSERRCQS